jgi:hypothetical protein
LKSSVEDEHNYPKVAAGQGRTIKFAVTAARRGEALIREGIGAPLYPTESTVPGVQDGKDQRMATACHRVNYIPGTRLAPSGFTGLFDGAKTQPIEHVH